MESTTTTPGRTGIYSDVEMTAAGYTNSEEEDYIMVVPEKMVCYHPKLW
jgi:hypothetical protein